MGTKQVGKFAGKIAFVTGAASGIKAPSMTVAGIMLKRHLEGNLNGKRRDVTSTVFILIGLMDVSLPLALLYLKVSENEQNESKG